MSRDVTRREFLHAGVTTSALVAGARVGQPAPAPRPNVLFILADDLGYGDLSCYGRPDYRTPVVDALAGQGMKFTSAYAAAPVCTPTRCALATGRYPQRLDVGLHEPIDRQRPRQGPASGSSDGGVAREGQRVRHGAHRQVAPWLETGVRPQPPWLRRVLRHPERCRRLLHPQVERLHRGRPLGEPRAGRTGRIPDGPAVATGPPSS